MVSPTQDNRKVRISTALPDNTLVFSSMSGQERLSELFEYQVELLSTDADIDLNTLLGQPITIGVDRPDGEVRYFNGYITTGSFVGEDDDFYLYSVGIRPWLWFLSRTTDCRIYQDMSAPDIIKDIFRSEGFSDFKDELVETYDSRNYCVQYRESDLDFINRLMEQEGIYYYFEHEDGKHNLVLCDNVCAHFPVANYENIPFFSESENPLPGLDYFEGVSVKKRVQSGRVVTNDFSFAKPRDNMLAYSSDAAAHAMSEYELFDYTSEYPSADGGDKQRGFGEHIARCRMQALSARHECLVAEGEVYGVGCGNLFTLQGSDQSPKNIEYLIVGSHFSVSLGGYVAGRSAPECRFQNRIEMIPSNIQYRSPRKTPKPRMFGPQTAMVVGKKGEEIWTDKHGRVKLQFHWDRYGMSDENSSCWVRVSQVWAGSKYGAMHIPRIGNEVIVEFIDGDPDQPIVTGRVYNGDNEVPYPLPANATQSGIKSRSSSGGSSSNFNEMRMEDKKGEEEFYFHAERNLTHVVKNDKSVTVGNNKTETVKKDKAVTVEGKHTETIKGDTSVTVSDGNFNQSIGKGSATVFAKSKVSVGTEGTLEIKSDGNMQLESDNCLTLKVGKSQIVLTPKKIEISSPTIEVRADVDGGSVSVVASDTVSIDGSSVTVN